MHTTASIAQEQTKRICASTPTLLLSVADRTGPQSVQNAQLDTEQPHALLAPHTVLTESWHEHQTMQLHKRKGGGSADLQWGGKQHARPAAERQPQAYKCI